MKTRDDLVAFGAGIQTRLEAWWTRAGQQTDFSAPAAVYYGRQSLHDFLERSTWHAAQHARQLQRIVEQLGITPRRPLTADALAGLPVPEKVWDDRGDAARLDDGRDTTPAVIGWNARGNRAR